MVNPVLDRILASGRGRLGEISLTREGGCIRVYGPGSAPGAPEAPADFEIFRRWIRETDDGHYRPLSGARSLRRNWVRTCPDPETAEEVVERVYPLALRHIQLRDEGRLEVTPGSEVIERQRGMYAAAGALGQEGRVVAREVLCSACVRGPLWDEAPGPGDDDDVPCPEPCGVLLALWRAAAGWEKGPPAPAAPDPEVRFAEFETPGNVAREAYLGRK